MQAAEELTRLSLRPGTLRPPMINLTIKIPALFSGRPLLVTKTNNFRRDTTVETCCFRPTVFDSRMVIGNVNVTRLCVLPGEPS